jgi:chemotaxis protein MotA
MRFSFSSLLAVLLLSLITLWGVLHVLNVSVWPAIPSSLTFLNLPSLAIVLGGVLLSVVISYPLASVKRALTDLTSVFHQPSNLRKSTENDLKTLLTMHKNYVLEGRRVFSGGNIGSALTLDSYFYELAGSDYSSDEVRRLAHLKSAQQYRTVIESSTTFKTMGNITPAFGMLGTLFGLIVMLSDYEQTQELAKGLAVALMTTLYGLLLSQLLFLPLSLKIQLAAQAEYDRNMLMIDGLLMIRENASILEIYDRFEIYTLRQQRRIPSKQRTTNGIPDLVQG